MTNDSYPARLGFEGPYEVKNWRPLVNWILAVPHMLVAYALNIFATVLTILAFFFVLITGAVPRNFFDLIVMTRRYRWRVMSYILWMRESYPPFDFTASSSDPGGDPATLEVDYPEKLDRWKPLYKWILAIPHFVVLAILWLAAVFVIIVAFFAVLFTGKYPAGIRGFLVGVRRWGLRVSSYAAFLRDEYPPFSLQ
jgi:Domain of unknown function (DUF4389)